MAVNYSQFPFAPMPKNPTSLLANPAQTAMQQRNSTGLLNLDPMQVQQARMRKSVADAEALNKRQMRGNMFMALGDAFRGKDMNANFLARQQHFQAQKAAEEKRKQGLALGESAYDYILKTTGNADMAMLVKNNPTLANEVIKNRFAINKSNTSNERFGLYNSKTNKLIGTVAKDDRNKISEYENDPNITVGQLRSPTVPTGKDDGMDLYSVTDASGKRVKTISNPTQQDIDELNKANLFVNKLPTPTDRGKGFDSGKPIEYKGWNDDSGLKSRYFATNTLINTGERLLEQLATNPDSVLTTADFAQYFERAKAEVGALGGRPENYTTHLNKNQQSAIAKLADEAAISESMLLDFTFQIAQSRGQTGKGLSDKDFVIFQKIISAGLTAKQKAAALTSFIEGIASEVNEDLTSNYNFYSKRLERNADDKEAMTFVTGIDDLRSMPFRNVVNPFAQPTNGTADPLGIR